MRRLQEITSALVQSQRRLSCLLERLLPGWMQIDGNSDFARTVVPAYLAENQIVYDVGGGKTPHLPRELKSRFNIQTVGIDISEKELDQAPAGTYDRKIPVDICRFKGWEDADLVICQALLEHVLDTEQALRAIATILRPGGRALLFLPSRTALFARLNRVLPQSTKVALLHRLYPETKGTQGFPAYYDRCTPAEFRHLASKIHLEVEVERVYYRSMYFSCFAPLHAAIRLYQLVAAIFFGDNAAETFVMCLRKPLRTAAAAA